MIAKIIGSGPGIQGYVDYGLHDQTSPEDPRPTTSERVAWTACLGLPVEDPQLMVRAMQGLTADAPARKAAAGLPATGRKLKKPYMHVVLSWPEGAEPSRTEMLGAVSGALKSLGIDERHYGVCAAHTDTDNAHVHAFVSRLDPATGKAANLDRGATQRLQRWAEQYEREHGGIVVPGRVAAREARESRISAARELRKGGVDPDQARTAAAILQPQPPHGRRATKSQPAPEPPTPDQRAEWAQLHGRQREELRRQRAADNERIARRRREWREWKTALAGARSAGDSGTVPPRPRGPSVRQLRADGARERTRLQRQHRTERAQLARRLRSPMGRAKAAGRTLWRRVVGRTPTTKATPPRTASAPDLQRLDTVISAKRDQARDALRDAETAVRKAERDVPRQRRKSAPASTTREREAREVFEEAVRDDRAAQRALRPAVRDHAAARDVLADATRAASRWTPNSQRAGAQRRAIYEAEDRLEAASEKEMVADLSAGGAARRRKEAHERWRAAAADKRRDRQIRRQEAREHRPARRTLRRLRQCVARLRRRLSAMDATLTAIERAMERLGLARRPVPTPTPAPARPAPLPDRGPSLTSIMENLDADAREAAARPARAPTPRTPPVRSPLREPRPPAAAGAGHPAGRADRHRTPAPPRRRPEPAPRPRPNPGSRPGGAEPPAPPRPAGDRPGPAQGPSHHHQR